MDTASSNVLIENCVAEAIKNTNRVIIRRHLIRDSHKDIRGLFISFLAEALYESPLKLDSAKVKYRDGISMVDTLYDRICGIRISEHQIRGIENRHIFIVIKNYVDRLDFAKFVVTEKDLEEIDREKYPTTYKDKKEEEAPTPRFDLKRFDKY